MKKILLFMGLMIGSFSVNAQLSCAAPIVLTTSGTYTVATITGNNDDTCYSNVEDDAGNPLKSNWYSFTSPNDVDVIIEADGTTDTSIQIKTGTCNELMCVDAADDIILFRAEAGVKYYIVWDSFYSNASFEFYLDIYDCITPTEINDPTNVTTTSATLNWEIVGSALQYEIEYGPVGYSDGGVSKKSFTNSLNLTGLNPSGNYEYYIRSMCDDNNTSLWNGPFDLNLLKTIPYTSGFDSNEEIYGWTVSGAWDDTFYIWEDEDTVLSQSPSQYIIFDNSKTAAVNNWMVSPEFALVAGQKINVSFYALTTTAANKKVKVTMGTGSNIASQTTILYSNESLNSDSDYTKYTSEDYTVPVSGTYTFGFNDYTPKSIGGGTMFMDTFSVNQATLGANQFISNKFDVYPNPASNMISIMNADNIQVNSISVTDLNGRIVKKQNYTNVSNITMNVSDLVTGVYMMNITSNKGTVTKKIIKN